jgi:hypothetical protein
MRTMILEHVLTTSFEGLTNAQLYRGGDASHTVNREHGEPKQ